MPPTPSDAHACICLERPRKNLHRCSTCPVARRQACCCGSCLLLLVTFFQNLYDLLIQWFDFHDTQRTMVFCRPVHLVMRIFSSAYTHAFGCSHIHAPFDCFSRTPPGCSGTHPSHPHGRNGQPTPDNPHTIARLRCRSCARGGCAHHGGQC